MEVEVLAPLRAYSNGHQISKVFLPVTMKELKTGLPKEKLIVLTDQREDYRKDFHYGDGQGWIQGYVGRKKTYLIEIVEPDLYNLFGLHYKGNPLLPLWHWVPPHYSYPFEMGVRLCL